jgi:hypothetical protein
VKLIPLDTNKLFLMNSKSERLVTFEQMATVFSSCAPMLVETSCLCSGRLSFVVTRGVLEFLLCTVLQARKKETSDRNL